MGATGSAFFGATGGLIALPAFSPDAADRRSRIVCCIGPTSGQAAAPRRPVLLHLTGFGPFGGVNENPTSIVCKILRDYIEHGNIPDGVDRSVLEELSAANICLEGLDALEVSAEACRENVPAIVDGLLNKVRSGKSDAVALVHLGVSPGSRTIQLECRGVNVADFRIPDVRGWQADGESVVACADSVLYTTLRLHEILGELHDRGVSCEISTDAGRYICNYIFFTSLHATKPTTIPVLFVHVPSFETMAAPTQVAAVVWLLLAIARQLHGGGTAEPVGAGPMASQKPLG